MGENNFKKIFFLILYVILLLISCWATAESLMLLQATIPPIFWYAIAVMLFVGASLGIKWAVDSFNQSLFIENRRLYLFGGGALFLLSWLCCSMPTNTHTFFYRSYIDSKVSSDITATKGYLNQLKTDFIEETLINQAQRDLENQVQTRMGELEAEIKNDANPGFGPKSKEILASFATLLGVPKIEPLTYTGTSNDARMRLADAYRQKIYTLMEAKKLNIKNSMESKDKTYRKEAAADIKNLETCEDAIKKGNLDLNRPKDIKYVCDVLDKGYSTIKNYSEKVYFSDNEQDAKERYLAENPVTLVRRMLSVFDVWHDFLNGEYPGTFWFWIILSVLVDLFAFVFYTVGMKKDY